MANANDEFRMTKHEGILSNCRLRRGIPSSLLGEAAFTILELLVVITIIIILAAITIGLLFHSLMYAGQPALMAEMFPTRMRYSGVSLGYQVTSIVAGSLAPIIAVALLGQYKSSVPVAIYLLGACVVTLVAVFFLKETRGISLRDVDAADAQGTADLLAASKK